jgi:hypothetical protein
MKTNMSFAEISSAKDLMKVDGYSQWTLTLYAVQGGDVSMKNLNINEFLE